MSGRYKFTPEPNRYLKKAGYIKIVSLRDDDISRYMQSIPLVNPGKTVLEYIAYAPGLYFTMDELVRRVPKSARQVKRGLKQLRQCGVVRKCTVDDCFVIDDQRLINHKSVLIKS